MVFSEADLLPGLIVDKYNDVLSMQALTQAFDRDRPAADRVVEALAEHFPEASVVERVDSHIRELEQLPPRESQLVRGERSSTIFTLNGVRFHFDGLGGQKTGAFLDQRENYAAAARYAHGDALDCFTYQGGFALHLARMCARASPLWTRRVRRSRWRNRTSSSIAPITAAARSSGSRPTLSTCSRTTPPRADSIDTIVLDPPAFAKTKRAVPTALRGYKELNLRALKMLRPGGILVTCSCSFHVSEEEFLEMLGAAASDAGRRVRILEKRGASNDHPALLNVPETAYLKCMICQVLS